MHAFMDHRFIHRYMPPKNVKQPCDVAPIMNDKVSTLVKLTRANESLLLVITTATPVF